MKNNNEIKNQIIITCLKNMTYTNLRYKDHFCNIFVKELKKFNLCEKEKQKIIAHYNGFYFSLLDDLLLDGVLDDYELDFNFIKGSLLETFENFKINTLKN